LARRSNKNRLSSAFTPDRSGGDFATQAADKGRDLWGGWVTLVTGVVIGGFLLWRNHAPPQMPFSEFNLLNTACILWIPLVVVIFGLRREPSEWGMTLGDGARGSLWALALFACFVPVILFIAPTPAPQRYYLNWMGGLANMGGSGAFAGWGWNGKAFTGGHIEPYRLLYHEVVMGFYMFGWEWHYRGFLLTGLRRILPTWGAVLAQAVLFTALHWGKPPIEVISSFPGAIIMALLALRFKSFVPCFLLHFLVSAGFDVAVLYYHFHPR